MYKMSKIYGSSDLITWLRRAKSLLKTDSWSNSREMLTSLKTEYLLWSIQEPAILPVPSRIKPLTPNDPYRGRTAPLTSKRFIWYIYSTNIGTEYFKRGIYSPFFSLFNMQFFFL